MRKEDQYIVVRGANEHNLKEVNVDIPRNQLVVITGISGSGKSSLAFDTIYAEGQRRYLDSFSSYARTFIGNIEKPDVEYVGGLSPVISIEQKSTSKNPRSTVGTVTEIYDFIRLFYARAAEAYSYNTGKKMVRFSEQQITDNLLSKFEDQKIVLLAPVVRGRKGHYRELFEQTRKQGYLKVRVDGEIMDILPNMQLNRYQVHDIEVVIDRLKVTDDNLNRIRQGISKALKMGNGLLFVVQHDTDEQFAFSKNLMCTDTGLAYEEPSPNTFSFNSPYGACKTCNGLGVIQTVDQSLLTPDMNKSIATGGIVPLGEERDVYLFRQLKKALKKLNLSIHTPLKDIPRKELNQILYGEDEFDKNKINTAHDRYITTNRKGAVDDRWYTLSEGGVAGMLIRCLKYSTSDSIRTWAESFMITETCSSCNGHRIKKEARHFKIGDRHIGELSAMNITDLQNWFAKLEPKLSERQLIIGKDVLKEIRARIGFLVDVGLDYLSLSRPSRTLSGGEAQRIRLASQIGSRLTGVTYILDEPSIGLHQRDNDKLIDSLRTLCDAGNTVIVVEHDKDMMLRCDYLIDLGPRAGVHGGAIVGEGVPSEFEKLDSLTAQYLMGRKHIEVPAERRAGNGNWLKLTGLTGNNLRNIDIEIPLGALTCVTGVSGSGKSTSIIETLYPILHHHFYRARTSPMPYEAIEGLEFLDKVIEIDQSPIGRTPRSNPATYIKVFDEIRRLYANLPEAKIRGYKPGRFSFNVKGGRCEECHGGGLKAIEMNFLPDVYVKCPNCQGKRYNRETLEIRYKGKSISDVLNMTVEEGVAFFESIPKIHRKLKTLADVGLAYLTIGQSSTTISGGEAQRVKLASELCKKDTGKTFYILDEPTTGLHFEDIRILMDVIQKLVDKGNTVLIIEHNLDVVKVADHVIDLGPEGGDGGGYIVAQGTPEEVVKAENSHTAKYLKTELEAVTA